MELEKTLTVAAPRQRVWDLLLDPKIMAGCVPGTESVEVLSDVEYSALIRVKISFVAARFKIRTRILEQRAPDYLRIEGTGEDSAVASSMKQTSELFLTDLGDGTTELRIKAKAEILGRLGSFGLSVMRTKADRMWEEFGGNLSATATRTSSPDPTAEATSPAGSPVYVPVQVRPGEDGSGVPTGQAVPLPFAAGPANPAAAPEIAAGDLGDGTPPTRAKWWQRIVGQAPTGPVMDAAGVPAAHRLPTDIYVELHRANGLIRVLWPASAASEAARWLKDVR